MIVGEEGYKALEKGDLITAYNEFKKAESQAKNPVELSKLLINEGAILIAFGRFTSAVEKLIKAKSMLSQAESDKKLLAFACLNLSKAMLMANRIQIAESEARCAENYLTPDDPHLIFVKALIMFYKNDLDGLLGLRADSLDEPYRTMVRVLQLKAKSDEKYLEDLKKLVPSSKLREALGLV